MKIKKSLIDSTLVIVTMFVTILPIFLAKQLVLISMLLLLARIVISKDIFLYLNTKIIIFILLLPGISIALFYAPEKLVRFAGILLIALGFPFLSFKINHTSVIISSILIIFYLIITQLMLLEGNQILTNFRDYGYSFELVEAHRNYGTTKNILKNAFDFSYWAKRAGGLYSNPNTFAAVLICYFFIFDISWKYFFESKERKIKFKRFFYLLIFLLVAFSLLQTKSKTFLVGFVVYFIFKNFEFNSLLKLKLKKKLLVFLASSIGIIYLVFESIIKSLFTQGGSAYIKFTILFDYLQQVGFLDILFGSNFEFSFDAEYGYWIGTAGLTGLLAFFYFYKFIYKLVPQSRSLIISFLFISIGSTLFYNLLIVSILIPLFIILISSNKNEFTYPS